MGNCPTKNFLAPLTAKRCCGAKLASDASQSPPEPFEVVNTSRRRVTSSFVLAGFVLSALVGVISNWAAPSTIVVIRWTAPLADEASSSLFSVPRYAVGPVGLVLTEAGSLVLNREHVEPGALVQDVLASFETQSEAFGVSMASAIASTVPNVDVDPARIRSAIANVVSNAIRHTPAGGSIRVDVHPTGENVEITVTDTGEGISPEILPRVFQRFVKGPGSTGSGLGLAITHDIITAHGGTVEIQSTVGSGTTVRITLPPATP